MHKRVFTIIKLQKI